MPSYTTQRGDNPAKLAKRFYGDERYANVVAGVWGNMQPGVALKLPDLKKYQADLAAKGEKHLVTQGEVDYLKTLGGRRPMRTAPPDLPSPTNTGSGYSQLPPTSYQTANNPALNYSALAATPVARPGLANPTARTQRPPKPPGLTYPASGVQALAAPPLQGANPLQPGAATGYYTGVGHQPYQPLAPKALQQTPLTYPLPPATNYPPNFVPQNNPQFPSNQQIIPTAGMTPAQQAAAIESGIYNKPVGTYQVRRGQYQPVLDPQGNIVGWELAQTGDLINVGAVGTKPGAYVGWTGDPLGKWQPGMSKVIGGGEGYKDYLPAGPPRQYTLPTPGGGGGGGPIYRGGGGGGGPRGGTGRYLPQSRYRPGSYAQGSSLPQGSRNPARDLFNPSRTGLVTWRLS